MEPTQLNGRSEDQILGAIAGNPRSGLAVTFGGELRYIKPLTINRERLWKEIVAERVGEGALAVGALDTDLSTSAGLAAVLGTNVDNLLDLIVEYDHAGGGTLTREWLAETATGTEARAVMEVLLDSAYPPVGAARPADILMQVLLAGQAARSAQAASMNASSPAIRGSMARRTSKRH